MSAASAWEQAVRAALLGTERPSEAVEIAAEDAELDGALAALAGQPAEARLLGTAALLDAWRRAGQRAPRIAARPVEPAPQPAERAASPLAAGMLRQLLAGGPAPLVAEWMVLARRAQAAIPHEMLPEVLDFARRHADVRDEVAAALGARGRWLAALNPAWSFAAGVAEEAAAGWETGTAEERVRILRHLRASDPAAALALLRTTWDADPPRDRAQFVEALDTGLGMDDEPFLEAALDDKRKEVRTAAAQLLATLPDSRLVKRMTERLLPLLALREPEGLVARIRGTGPRMDAQLPAECDKTMRRDGVEPKPTYNFGERAWWLHQMLASVPPALWTAHWGRAPAELLQAARGGENGDVLTGGWTDAAIRTRDADWAEARLRTMRGNEALAVVHRLAATLPPERLEALILWRLPADRLADATIAGQMLQAARFAWSPALTRAVLSVLPRQAGRSEHDYLLRGLGPYMHPTAAAATLREQGDPHEGPWVDLLHLRATLHQAFE